MASEETGSGQGDNRVNRGGSWNNNASNCRAANRNRNNPGNRNNNLGFRPAPAPPQLRPPRTVELRAWMEPASGPVPTLSGKR
jgi:hypothetical protein